jgi:hypothetical protein
MSRTTPAQLGNASGRTFYRVRPCVTETGLVKVPKSIWQRIKDFLKGDV